MKIIQVSPLHESVPPKLYGGTERVVSYLTEALVKLGHDVTLYASGDSQTRAELRPICEQALRLDPTSIDPLANHVYMAERVAQECGDADIIHSHIDYLGFPFWRRVPTPHVTTLHGRLDIPNLPSLYREFADESVISISDAQRTPLDFARWHTTVPHGLPENLYEVHEKNGGYFAFLGRINPEKRVDLAIRVARRAGVPLKIAAKIDKVDREYFETIVKPLLGGDIEYIGEIGERDKNAFLGGASALMFMIDWPEPFGLVMIEAMACGTPVIAMRRGSVPEVIDDGLTGFIVDGEDSAVRAVENLHRLDRKAIRRQFEHRFTAARMARDYVATYAALIRLKEEAA